MDASAVVMELGLSMQKVAALSHQILHTCLHRDGLELLRDATEHAFNVTYVTQRIFINGADVCNELADGVEKWNDDDRSRFRLLSERVARDFHRFPSYSWQGGLRKGPGRGAAEVGDVTSAASPAPGGLRPSQMHDSRRFPTPFHAFSCFFMRISVFSRPFLAPACS